MSQADTLKMLMEIDSGNSNTVLDALSTRLRNLGDSALKVAEDTGKIWPAMKSGAFEGLAQSVDGVKDRFDAWARGTENLANAARTHLPAAGKHAEEFGNTWKKVHEEMHKAQESIVKGLEPALGAMGLSALTATASVGGLIAAVQKFGETGHHMDEFARRTGFSIEYLDRLTGSARQFGTTSEEIEGGIRQFSRSLQELHTASGGNIFGAASAAGRADIGRQMKATQNDSGLSEAEKTKRNFELAIQLIHQQIENKNEPLANAIAEQMFGASFANSAVNIARKSMTEINAILAETGRLQGPLDPKAAEEYEKAMGRAIDAITGLQRAIVSKVLPEITHASEVTTKWLGDLDKDDIGRGVFKFIQDLKSEVEGLKPALDLLQKMADLLNQTRNKGNDNLRSGEGILFNVPKALAGAGLQGASDLLSGDRNYGDTTSQLTATGGIPTASPQQNIPDIGSLLKPVKPGQFAVGANEITQPGLAFVHEGEQIRPAELNGPYKSADAGGSAFQQAHSEENRRAVDTNTSQIKALNEKLQKLIDADTADGTAGGGVFGGSGGAGSGGGPAGGSGFSAGGGMPGNGAAGAAGAMYGNAGSGGTRSSGTNYGPSDSSAPGGNSEGAVGKPGGSSFEDSQSIGKAGGLAAALKGADGSGFASSLPGNHPAIAAAQKAARNLSTGGATGGGAAAGFKDSGSGFSKVQGGASLDNPEHGITDNNGRAVDPETLNGAMAIAKTGNAAGMKSFLASHGYPLDATACGAIATRMASKAGVTPPSSPAMGSSWLKVGQHEDPSEINNPEHGGLGRTFAASRTQTYGPHVGAPISPGQKYGHVKTVVPGSFDSKTGTAQFIDQYGVHRDKIGNYDIRYAGAPKAPQGTQNQNYTPVPQGALQNGGAGRNDVIGGESEYPGVPKALSQFTALKENFTPNAFNDYGQKNIGYGTSANGRTSIDEPTARREMNEHLSGDLNRIDRLNPSIPPGQRMALASLDYNTGFTTKDNEKNKRFQDAIRRGDWQTARQMFSTYNHTGGPNGPELRGLTNRRNQELSALWDNKDYSFDRTKVTSAAQDFGGRQDPNADVGNGPPQAPQANGLKPWPSDAPGPPKAPGELSDTARNPGAARPSLASADETVKRMNQPGALSAAAGKADSMTHKVEGTGHIKVDVNGPAGTKASAKGSGLFNKTTLNRNMANQRSAEHSAPQASK